jgi:integrase/recombinase XerD
VPTRAGVERLSSLLAVHLQDLRARRFSPAAQKVAERVLPRFFLHLREEGLSDVRAVREEHVTRFACRLASEPTGGGTGLALASQAAYLGAVKRFFAFLARRRTILADPARDLALPNPQRLPKRVLSEAQARRLMAAPFPGSVIGLRDRAILETLYGTGLRRGECLRLDLMDLDLGQGVVLVRDGKGKKDRVVPVAGRAALALDVYLLDSRPELQRTAREGALFLSYSGRRLSKAGLGLVLERHAQAIGLRTHPHALRHACATHLLKGGADVRHIQELLGHKSLQSTQLYTRVGVEDLREVLARAHPRERSRGRRRRR